jgi:hypothetical protein
MSSYGLFIPSPQQQQRWMAEPHRVFCPNSHGFLGFPCSFLSSLPDLSQVGWLLFSLFMLQLLQNIRYVSCAPRPSVHSSYLFKHTERLEHLIQAKRPINDTFIYRAQERDFNSFLLKISPIQQWFTFITSQSFSFCLLSDRLCSQP